MTWHLRSPQSFPAHFSRILREAIAFQNRPILFGSYRTHGEANVIAANFRHFRWCLRQQPGIMPHLSALESAYQFRLSRTHESGGFDHPWVILYLTAMPTKLSQLVDLNPHLAEIISAEAS